MQKVMLLESERVTSANIVQWVWRLPFQLNKTLVERACAQLFIRHNALRGYFQKHSDNSLSFCIADVVDLVMHYEQSFCVSLHDVQQLLDPYLAHDRYSGFDTSAPPLFRCHLLYIDSGECLCVFTFHRAIVDNYSFKIILDEFISFYNGDISSDTATLDHSDFLAWPADQNCTESKRYWRSLLQGYSEPVLPHVVPGISDNAYLTKHSKVTTQLPKILTKKLLSLAADKNVLLESVIQAAWAIVLNRYCDTNDIVFGVTHHGRNWSADSVARRVGFFVNTLPVRVVFKEPQLLCDLLIVLENQNNRKADFEHTSLQAIQSLSNIPKGKPLVATSVNIEEFSLSHVLERHGAQWAKSALDCYDESEFELSCNIFIAEQLHIEVDFDVDKYDTKAARQILRHFQNVLSVIANDADVSVSQIEMLDEQDLQQLKAFAGTQSASNSESENDFVHRDIVLHARRYPNDIAVCLGKQTLTYAELEERSRVLALHLIKCGVQPESIVGICLHKSMEWIIAIIAVLRAGGTYLPLETKDPGDRLRAIAKDADTAIILTIAKFGHLFTKIDGLMCLFVDGHWDDRVLVSRVDEVQLLPSNAAYIIYTSGTTGTPKGVVVEHRSLSHYCKVMGDVLGCKRAVNVLQFASCAFDVSIEEIFTTLTRGGCLVLLEQKMLASVQSFFSSVQEHNITLLNLPTAFWNTLVDAASNYGLSWPQCVQTLVVGGEQISTHNYRAFREQGSQHIRFINGYGPTETTVTSTYCHFLADSSESEAGTGKLNRESLPIGQPLPGVKHYILDSEGRLCPPNVPGQLYIGGAHVARGYYNRGSLTAEKFCQLSVPNEEPLSRYYATGDRVYHDCGYWYFIGRVDHQIKVRGYRIELGEIESALCQHPFVQAALVERDTQHADILVAFVESQMTGDSFLNELNHNLAECLPHYMVPSKIEIFDQFPLNKAGKPDRNRLKHKLELRTLEKGSKCASNAIMTKQQNSLAGIWRSLLEIDSFSTRDSFFELGGHSLLAVKMFSELEKSMGVAISVRHFFTDPTLETLDKIVSLALNDDNLNEPDDLNQIRDVGSLYPLQPKGQGCPLYCICGIELYQDLANMLGTKQPVYGIFLPVEEQMLKSFSANDEINRLPSVQDIAKEYVKVIRENQPFGPYKLAGLSFGGILAYEIAQQLSNDGETVETLILLDSFVPQNARLFTIEKYHTQWRLMRAEGINYLSRVNQKLISWIKVRWLEFMTQKITSKSDNVDFTHFRSMVYRKSALAYGQHINKYQGDVIVVHAEGGGYEREGMKGGDHGWGEFVNGTLAVHRVPGDHTGILKQPNVAVLAENIRAAIVTSAFKPTSYYEDGTNA